MWGLNDLVYIQSVAQSLGLLSAQEIFVLTKDVIHANYLHQIDTLSTPPPKCQISF